MITAIVAFLITHSTAISIGAVYVYVLLAGTQPPLSPAAGYWKTWSYRLFQAGAANFRQRGVVIADSSTTTSSTTQPTVDSPTVTVVKGK